jgi:hypothetical protein
MRVEKLGTGRREKHLVKYFIQDKMTGCVKDISMLYRVEFRSAFLYGVCRGTPCRPRIMFVHKHIHTIV